MRSLHLILFLLLFSILNSIAQYTQNIRGRVIDKASGSPLTGANVLVLEAGPITGVVTDEDGIFYFEEIPVGRYNILISYVGYQSFIMQEVLVGTGKEVFLDISLKETIVTIDEVTIEATVSKDQPLNPMANISARSFTVEETEKYAGSWGDPSRMASNYAGVVPNGDNYNFIVIRGNSPAGLVWRLEGIPIPNPNHYDVPGATGGPISILNNNTLANSDFLTSAFPAEYGDGISGVFDLRLRRGNNQKREYLAQIGMMGIELGAEGPFTKKHKASYLIDFRYSMLGLVEELLWVEAVPYYQDLTFKLDFPTKKGNIEIFGLGGSSHITGYDEDSPKSTPTEKHEFSDKDGSKTGIVGIKQEHFFNVNTRMINHIALSASQSLQDWDSIVNGVETTSLRRDRMNEYRFLISSKLLKKINSKNSVNVGANLENHNLDYSIQNDYDIFNLPGKDSLVLYPPMEIGYNNLNVFQGFIEWKHRFTNTFELYSGLHYTHFFLNNSKALEPRTNLKWKFSDKQSISAGFGMHSQLQPMYIYLLKTYITDDPWDRAQYIESNRDLGFTKSYHFAIGYDYLINWNLRFKSETYLQEIFNVPVEKEESYFSLINAWGDTHVPIVDSLVSEGTGRNLGIECTFERFLSNNYYYLVTASFLDSKYKGSDGKTRPTAFNNNYMINSLVGYELPVKNKNTLNVNVRLVFAGGRRIVPHDEIKTIEEDENVYVYEKAFEESLAAYFRLDARVGYHINREKTTHEIAADMVNLTNRPNEFQRRYNGETKTIDTYYQQGFFVTVYYRIHF